MPRPTEGGPQPQLLMQLTFDGRPQISIGRAPDNDIRLDGLQISNHHARLRQQGDTVFVEDAGSTNGVYVNGARITGRRPIQNQDIVQIGPFVVQADAQRGIAIFDTRSKTRIDCIDITKEVKNRSGGGKIKLLDDVDLTIQPNEFVGLLGDPLLAHDGDEVVDEHGLGVEQIHSVECPPQVPVGCVQQPLIPERIGPHPGGSATPGFTCGGT